MRQPVLANVRRENAYSPRVALHVTITIVLLRASQQIGHQSGLSMTQDGPRGKPSARRGRDAVPCAPRARRTSILKRGALPALPARCVKSDRRRRRLYVAPRERRRDGRRARERALLPCVDLTSRSCRDVELRVRKKSRSSARSRKVQRAVPERRVMARTRCSAYEVTHGAYTWPRTATERRTTSAAAPPNTTSQGHGARPSSSASRYQRAD